MAILKPDFSHWNVIIAEVLEGYIYPSNYDADRSFRAVKDLVNVFAEIFQYSKNKSQIKDNSFIDDIYRLFPFGTELTIESKKIGAFFYYGIDDNGLYIRSNLRHCKNLRLMDDAFWSELLSLNSYGELKYTNHSLGDKENPGLYKNNKGVIFRILRDHILDFSNSINYQGLQADLEVRWNLEETFNWEALLDKYLYTLKTLYILQYKLYKKGDTREEQPKRWVPGKGIINNNE